MVRNRNILNLKTEKEGIIILKSIIKNFIVPTIEQKKYLYELLKISYSKYSKSIDGVILNVNDFKKVKSEKDFMLIEIKTTASNTVKELPYRVFFGFTKNEEDLFKKLDNYRLCIVHTKLKKHILLNYEEYKSLIKRKTLWNPSIYFKIADLLRNYSRMFPRKSSPFSPRAPKIHWISVETQQTKRFRVFGIPNLGTNFLKIQ